MYDHRQSSCGTSWNSAIWFNNDPCGIICASITWILVLFAEYAIIGSVILPWLGHSFLAVFHSLCFSMIAGLALASHGKAMLTDPGSVPKDAVPLISTMEKGGSDAFVDIGVANDRNFKSCRRCHSFKPVRAHHCSYCQRCILKMDHCPWVNSCVGLGNHKFFLLFIFYVFLMSFYSTLLVFGRYTHCMNDYNNCPNQGAMKIVLVVAESFLFGLFTLCMMCDQYGVVTTGTTQIDRYKGEEIGETLGLQEVFGGSSSSFAWHWLLPIPIWFPSSIQDEILGYAFAPDENDEDHSDNIDDDDDDDDDYMGNPGRSKVLKETLHGGWSVEKHIAHEDDKDMELRSLIV